MNNRTPKEVLVSSLVDILPLSRNEKEIKKTIYLLTEATISNSLENLKLISDFYDRIIYSEINNPNIAKIYQLLSTYHSYFLNTFADTLSSEFEARNIKPYKSS